MFFQSLTKKCIIVEVIRDEINDNWISLLDTLQVGYLDPLTNYLVDLKYHTIDKFIELPKLGKIQSIWTNGEKYIILKELEIQ
mgnify:CR=1 FL=1